MTWSGIRTEFSAVIIRLAVISAAVVLLVLAPLQAQVNDDSVSDTNVEPLPSSQPVLEYVLTGVFLLAALAIGFLPSKRSTEELVIARGGPL
jgi:preprotein translocase subunit SecG